MKIGWKTDNPPDGYDNYLVQYEGGEYDIAYWSDVNPFWVHQKTDWHWSGTVPYSKVIAWMPLPEPYKEATQ